MVFALKVDINDVSDVSNYLLPVAPFLWCHKHEIARYVHSTAIHDKAACGVSKLSSEMESFVQEGCAFVSCMLYKLHEFEPVLTKGFLHLFVLFT